MLLATSGPRKGSPKKKAEESNPAHDMHVHWGYDGLGAPDKWAKLKSEYATCDSGKRQSPIDIREGIKVDLEGIKFDYKPTKFRIVDNGHTVQVNVGDGSTIQVMGKRYELVQFHFHKPSEERINGRPFDMVIHFVHKDYDGNLAVIAVLLERGNENSQIQTLWNNMPLEANQELGPNDVLETIKLFPENRTYWTYMGSLTTPPCTENVLWMVMKQPVQLSPEQVAIFARLYKNNARPVQPSNGRLVKESR
jgi:carbonic anhydrase